GTTTTPIMNAPGPGVAFTCDATTPPASTPLPRLSQAQYVNTLHDIVKFALGGDEGATTAVLSAPDAMLAMADYPVDEHAKTPRDRFGTYRRMNQEVQDAHVRSTYAMAIAVGTQLTTSQKLGTVVGACATDADTSNDATCITSFITNFGLRALRRPLTPDEVTFYRGFYGTSNAIDPAAFADVIGGFLTAPQFLYIVEHGDTPVANKANVYALTSYEIASRLSYQFIQSMPDAALLAAAADGSLIKNPTVYAAQVDRLLADPRAKTTFDEFFFDYFKLFQSDIRNLVGLDARNGNATFKAFAGTDLPSSTLGTEMQTELVDMSRYFTFTKPGSLSSLLTTDYSFAKTADLAKIYDIGVWNGTSEPPKFPADTRPGFLTRAAFLTSGGVGTRPIMKGVFIRKFLLCDDVPDPPANAANTPIDTSTKNTRQAVEGITEQEGTSCTVCHKSLINPLGFSTEIFDALGRARKDQPLFDATGNITTRVPVDAHTVPQVVSGDMTESSGPADVVRLINSSAKAHACFARNYFRFTFRRLDDPATDGCALERLRQKVMHGTLSDAFRDVALTDEFKSRNFQ
ncbi:MAG: hypothetical protein JWM82_2422, partial [Myxococcales bacterium]|nr:hypothetical protein [Myxococcales bacterium]